jgi:hypothetical protein
VISWWLLVFGILVFVGVLMYLVVAGAAEAESLRRESERRHAIDEWFSDQDPDPEYLFPPQENNEP